MIFNLFKKKDHLYYLNLARKALAAERYADARTDFQEALSRCPEQAGENGEIRDGLVQAGDGLGQLNLHEAERSLNAGDLAKAADHFALARDFSCQPQLKERAAQGLKKLERMSAEPAGKGAAAGGAAASAGKGAAAAGHGGSSCGSCATDHRVAEPDLPQENLSDEDRFALLVHPLPLGARYAALGEKFRR